MSNILKIAFILLAVVAVTHTFATPKRFPTFWEKELKTQTN
jgi:hypothetical protein